MKVRELMTTALVTVRPETPVLEARQRMQGERIRHLLVTSEDGWLQGIVTDRDIRLGLPSPAASLSLWEITALLARLTVGQVMSPSLVTVGPEWDAREAARLMLEHRIGALPVIHGSRPVGIVTESDFVRAFVHLAPLAMTA